MVSEIKHSESEFQIYSLFCDFAQVNFSVKWE